MYWDHYISLGQEVLCSGVTQFQYHIECLDANYKNLWSSIAAMFNDKIWLACASLFLLMYLIFNWSYCSLNCIRCDICSVCWMYYLLVRSLACVYASAHMRLALRVNRLALRVYWFGRVGRGMHVCNQITLVRHLVSRSCHSITMQSI